MASRAKLILVDGHAVAYRQYYALPLAAFSTRQGEPTNATFGFTRILLDILQKDKPEYVAVSFDLGLSGRDELYGEYKGHREKMEDDLRRQVGRIMQVVETFNMPVLALEGYEADDVIGTVTQQAEAKGVHTHIITGDRDILQLLTPHVTVQLPSRTGPDEIYDEARFREKYGLEPHQLVDLKALMGDASDNIPGVKGIGDKTATTLLQTYGSLDGVYAHIDEIKGALQKKLIEGRDLAYLSRELAAIKRDVPITLDLNACIAHDFDADEVAELFRELEFRSLSDRLAKMKSQNAQPTLFDLSAVESAPIPPNEVVNTVIVQDEAGLSELINALKNAPVIVWDVETTSTDQMRAELVGIALAVDADTGYYVPVGHQNGQQLALQTVLDALNGPLTDAGKPKHAHNASYDLVVMQRYGINVSPITFDTMVAEWMRDTSSKFLGLKNFANQYLRIRMTDITELIGSGKKQITMDQVAIERAAPYAAADAAITYRAVELLRPELEKEREVFDLFNTLEMPLVPVIAAMEQAGVVLDTVHLQQMSDELATQLARLAEQIYGYAGGEFNIDSTKQLNSILFDKLGLSVEGLKKRQHGYSTDAATLENLKNEHPIVKLILEHREISKLKGTYVDALPELINPRTGRVHTSYNQTGTSTGRFSSSNPNLQNIPIRTELGRQVRRAFVAPPGSLLLSVDYSQVELRILAHISQDRTLLEAFRQNQDIHRATAAAVYGVPLEAVTYEQRSFAKRVNFGLIYGMGAFRLARDSDLTLAEAEAFIRTYFERLPQVRAYLDGTKRFAYQNGYVKTLMGRRGEFGVLKESGASQQIKSALERAAINMPIQGTAADIMKKAMLTLYGELNRRKLNGRIILQVHDELVLEVPERELVESKELTVAVMEGAYQLDAPLKANAQAGNNWRDMEAV